jgi:hypothetical protein
MGRVRCALYFGCMRAPCGSNNRYMSIFLHYNTTRINNWTPPSEPIFLGGPPFFGQNYLMTHPLFLPAHPQS